jgi:hypothetical protein
MHLAAERGVPQEERKTAPAGLTDWDAARIFLEVVRRGSFRSAADRLGLSINAVAGGSMELKAVYVGGPLTHLFGGFSSEGR